MANFFKERLIQARLFWGFSLQDIGDKLEVSKQYIQQIENGAKIPNELFLNALADILGVKPCFFEKPVVNAMMESQCHFRKARTTAISIKERALQQSSLFEDLINFIDDELSLPEVKLIECSPQNNESIEQAAENCRRQWNINLDTPIKNISYYLEKAGIVITMFSGISEKIDAFSINRKRPIIIRNPEKDKLCRLRFDLAHEYGHLVLHNGIATGDTETEKQANRFASAFLLPRGAFLREFSPCLSGYRIKWKDLLELKAKWKVSLQAIICRAYDLGIIDSVKYRSAFIYLNNNGYTKNEPLDDILPMEQPVILHKSLEMLDKNDRLSYYMNTRGISSNFLEQLSGYHFCSHPKNIVNIENYR